ncbi:MAG: large conductance mechanosensitive channel protein MscL [Polyangiaceae bacterium]|nr:large conductance mechanosensitive channel protein MscL [Polyangiaceae bacterium]
MLEDFKKFILRGNVVDLAVGVIIGGAFGKIVESLVKDVVMPPIGLALGKVSFVNMYKVLKEGDAPIPPGMPYDEALKVKGAVLLGYGSWINHIISFLIVAFCVFMIVRMVNKLYPPPKPADPEKPAQEKLLEEIRDLLKKQP